MRAILLLPLCLLVGCGGKPKPEAYVSAPVVAREFAADDVRSEKRYTGKVVQMHGNVYEIYSSKTEVGILLHEDFSSVLGSDPNTYSTFLWVKFPIEKEAEVRALPVGEWATVAARFKDVKLGDKRSMTIIFEGLEIVKPQQTP